MGAIPFHVREVLGRAGPEEEEEEDAADVPGLQVKDAAHHGPARDLEQASTRHRDSHVRPKSAFLGPPKGWDRIDKSQQHPREENEEAFVPLQRCRKPVTQAMGGIDDYEPCRDDRQEVKNGREPPALSQGEGPGDQRPVRFVLAIDLEVVELVDPVGSCVQESRANGAESNGRHYRRREPARRIGIIGGAIRRHRPGNDSQERGQEGEGSREGHEHPPSRERPGDPPQRARR